MSDYRIGADGSGSPVVHDWTEHLAADKKETYLSFINMLRAALLLIAFALTALVCFGFGHILPVTLGFIVLLAGALAVFIDLSRHSHFGLSLAVLAVAVLFVAVSVG